MTGELLFGHFFTLFEVSRSVFFFGFMCSKFSCFEIAHCLIEYCFFETPFGAHTPRCWRPALICHKSIQSRSPPPLPPAVSVHTRSGRCCMQRQLLQIRQVKECLINKRLYYDFIFVSTSSIVQCVYI